LRGLTVEGTERPGARDRNGARNALFADLLVTTGLRLEEASHLLAAEIPVGDARAERQRRVELPAALTKGDRGRSMLLPRRLLPVFDAYIAVERAEAVAKFASAVAGKPSTARSSSTPLIRAERIASRWRWHDGHGGRHTG
jgi:integrase